MLKLKNVSKFYYSKGVIASGFTKVNLELNMGEFVVITGESGSGKSTLLNVLSGLDTYEEGEMYINGEETSHYNEADFEEYRRKYVGNIFQNFNLINSYTVFQNVELALLLNGENKKDVKEKVNEIIDKVGLAEFSATKCAKLSGGQKQRVAIARALAKETPIIVADEPTGNLDTESAAEVIKLLAEIAKDKLVIIVTHNLEQVEHHATRLIKMHDGKILEDKMVTDARIEEGDFAREYADLTFGNRVRLGVRNAFNIPSKFILIFAVFTLIAFALGGTYAAFQQNEYEESTFGWNQFFRDVSDQRIVINHEDKSPITEEEFEKLEALPNVDKVEKDDILIDYSTSIVDKDWYNSFYGNVSDVKNFKGEIAHGRMPKEDNEIIVVGNKDDYWLNNDVEKLLKNPMYFDDYTDSEGNLDTSKPLQIVGIAYHEDTRNWDNQFYMSEELIDSFRSKIYLDYVEIKSTFAGNTYESNRYDPYFQIVPNDKVPSGKAYVSAECNSLVEYGYCIGKEIKIDYESLYTKESMTVKIDKTYTKYNFESLLGYKYSEISDGMVYVNKDDYENLTNQGVFQSSVYVKDVKILDETVAQIEEIGLKTLPMKNALNSEGADIIQILSMVKTFVIAAMVIALFFISYFIIKIILKSRNAYYTTIRTLGGSKKISKQLLDIELVIIALLAYILFMVFIALVEAGVIAQKFIVELVAYLTPMNYVLMLIILVVMAYLISTRFAANVFQKSVMSTYREEV